MLRNLFLGLISTHIEVKAYSVIEGARISALMTVAGIDKLWVKQYMTTEGGYDQVTTFKVETSLFLLWNIAKFKKMVDKLNHELITWRNPEYIDVKFMVPVRDSKEIEALI